MKSLKKIVLKYKNSLATKMSSVKKLLKRKMRNVISSLKNLQFLGLGVIVILSVGVLHNIYKIRKQHAIIEAAVMITNFDGNSGGTGVVIEIKDSQTSILTNAHVCDGLIESGGMVKTTDEKQYQINSFKLSRQHDLCLIKIMAKLPTASKISTKPLKLYEDVIVSGHPRLGPITITRGQYNKNEIVDVMVDVQKCTEKDFKEESKLFYCYFLGGIPIVKMYEAMIVTAEVHPGSSGSAVYNENGEIVGLIFGLSGNTGHGLAVPLEYIHNFLNQELSQIEEVIPKNTRLLSPNK